MRCPECGAVVLPGEPTGDGVCSVCAKTDPLVECPLCGRCGLPERIRAHECENSCPEPFEMIAPRDDDVPAVRILSGLLAGIHTHGAWLGYHELRLYKVSLEGSENVWDVHTQTSRDPIEVLNCAAFKTASGLEAYLDDLRMVG